MPGCKACESSECRSEQRPSGEHSRTRRAQRPDATKTVATRAATLRTSGLGLGLLRPEAYHIEVRRFAAQEHQLELAFTGRKAQGAAPGSIVVVWGSAHAGPVGKQEAGRG